MAKLTTSKFKRWEMYVADHGNGLNFERRRVGDRRKREVAPFDGVERRISAERRRPEVTEVTLSVDEWEQLFGEA